MPSRQKSVHAPSRTSGLSRRSKRAAHALRQALLETLEARTLLSASIWSNATVPTVTAANDPSSVEVGVKFRSDVAGYITGIRFYKGSGNTGTHLGDLWTSNGTLLGETTFTSESASGWQQATFATPIAVAANTTYVASYFAPTGNYAVDLNYFAGAGVDSAPLHALKDGVDGGNGLFTYSSGSTFPGSTFSSANYWVDVIFDTTISLSVVSTSPGAGATNISPGANATVTFNSDMNPVTINGNTVQLRDSANAVVAATVTYNAATRTATIDPTASLALNGNYTISVVGGASGVKTTGNLTLGANFTSSFKVASSLAVSIWNATATPAVAAANDANAVELGVRFRSDVDGLITGIRFYKGAGNDGIHTGNLWTSTGTLLGTATFTNETATGWQEATFATPVAITANTIYVASYYAPVGHYAVDAGYFAASGADNTPLHALQDGVGGGNGLFSYMTASGFPTSTFGSNNYWVDPVFLQPVTNTAPVAQNKSASVTEDGIAPLALVGTDQQTAASQLTFKVLTLPTQGVLKVGGVKVVAGQTFVGAPANLTYEPSAETEGGTADSFNYTVSDPQGLSSAAATVSLSVTKAVADGAVTFSGGILRIGGTSRDDLIIVARLLGKLLVSINGQTVSSNVDASSVSEIRVWGRAGSDAIVFLGVTNNTFIVGGSGNDAVLGGGGNDLVLGGDGNDTLIGDSGNDMLVGGDGSDILLGMDGNDMLVGGGVNAIASLADLRAMATKWSSNPAPSASDVATAKMDFSDVNKGDIMSGGSGTDWFVGATGDIVLDKQITDFLTTLP